MPANEYTLYNSPLTVLCRLALPMAVCAALAVALLSEPPDSIPFAIIISGIIFLSAFFLLFIRALLDRSPQLTLSPKGLFIQTKFSEIPLDGTHKPRKRKEAFYTWRNLGSPKLDPRSYMLTLMANDLPEFPEAPPPLPDNAKDEQAGQPSWPRWVAMSMRLRKICKPLKTKNFVTYRCPLWPCRTANACRKSCKA